MNLNIPKLVDDAKELKIKNYPQHVNRASSIGHPCDRYLVYCRTRWQDKKMHDVGLQRVFDLGNLYERAVMDDLREAGLYVEEQQTPFFDERYKLSGHIDGKLPIDGQRPPLEIKSMAPFTWEKINNWQDFLRAKQAYLRSYPYQLTTYLFLHDEPYGIMLLKNKVSGQLKQIIIPKDQGLIDEILQKCGRINTHVEQNTLPDPIKWEDGVCGQCGYLHICYPGRDFGPGIELLDDEELEAMLDKRESLAASAKEYKEIDETVKIAFKERPCVLIGAWEITGKWVEKKDSKHWRSRIIRKPPETPQDAMASELAPTHEAEGEIPPSEATESQGPDVGEALTKLAAKGWPLAKIEVRFGKKAKDWGSTELSMLADMIAEEN